MRLFMLLLCLPYAATVLAADLVFDDWRVSVDEKSLQAYTANESGSTLALTCSDKSCFFFLRTRIECEDGRSYFAMINSENETSPQKLFCNTITIDGRQEYITTIDDTKSFTFTVLRSSSIAIAIPMVSGQFKVLRFSLHGAPRALLAFSKLLKTRTSSPPPSSKQGFGDATL